MKIKENLYFRESNYSDQQNEAVFTYKGLADWLDLGLGFKLIHKENTVHKWLREN